MYAPRRFGKEQNLSLEQRRSPAQARRDELEATSKTPNAVAAENTEYLLARRGLSRRELAGRMNALGFGAWEHEKTVRRALDGEKRITTDELVGLALALETTVESLLTPGLERYAEEGTGDLYSYKESTRAGNIYMPRVAFLEVISSRSRDARPTPHEACTLPSTRLWWDEWDRVLDEGHPPRPALSDPEAEFLRSMRSDIHTLYRSLGKQAPDDLESAGIEELNGYVERALAEGEGESLPWSESRSFG